MTNDSNGAAGAAASEAERSETRTIRNVIDGGIDPITRLGTAVELLRQAADMRLHIHLVLFESGERWLEVGTSVRDLTPDLLKQFRDHARELATILDIIKGFHGSRRDGSLSAKTWRHSYDASIPMASCSEGVAMSALLPPAVHDRLAKLGGLLTSDAHGERAAAAKKASDLPREYKVTWAEVLNPPCPPCPRCTGKAAQQGRTETYRGDAHSWTRPSYSSSWRAALPEMAGRPLHRSTSEAEVGGWAGEAVRRPSRPESMSRHERLLSLLEGAG